MPNSGADHGTIGAALDLFKDWPATAAKLISQFLKDGIPPSHWRGGHNTPLVGPVTEAKCGINGTSLWVRFRFRDGAAEHLIEGALPLPHGETEYVRLDTQEQASPHVSPSVKPTIPFPSPSFSFYFALEGKTEHFRFDGRVVTL